jgi:hypothetical protein
MNGKNHSEDLSVGGDNIKMGLKDVGLEGVGWIDVFQDRDW